MTDAAAFQATIHGLKTVPTRKVVQVVVEAPIESLPQIARIAEHGAWVAVARLTPNGKEGDAPDDGETQRIDTPPRSQSSAGGAKSWHDLSPAQQAGILCADPKFQLFLSERHYVLQGDDSAAEFVREYCSVRSRSQIERDAEARDAWQKLVRDFRAWMREPEIVG